MSGFPFAAIVGQDDLRLALRLLAVHPAIGGVLARGDKGSAKSTAARALGELMGGEDGGPAPFVTLPLGATEDRVVGTLDLDRALRGEKALQPGLIREAHGGVLYIDEVNLLADHLVDVLLDVAAMGVNRVQREGLAEEHAARFALVGTMNPEEGTLRPQFLDRFGLCVDVLAPTAPRERAEVVRRRARFEADPVAFAAEWADEQARLRAELAAARERLPRVAFPDGLLEAVAALCAGAGVRSLRADLVLHRAARAHAALAGRDTATAEDVRRVAPLVLAHRRADPRRAPGGSDDLQDLLDRFAPPENDRGNGPEDGVHEGEAPPSPPDAENDGDGEDAPPVTLGAASGGETRRVELRGATGALAGRRATAPDVPRGRTVREERDGRPESLAVGATLRSAALRAVPAGVPVAVTRDDLHGRVREGRAGARVLFVVDASGSMNARARMEAVKGAALDLLADASTRRDEVGVIAFRGAEAEVLLPFARDAEVARAALERLPTGGRTPLAHALVLADAALGPDRRDALLVLLTDGRGNVPLPGGGDAWAQARSAAARLAGTPALVVDTEAGLVRLGRAGELAAALGAECLALESLTAESLALVLRARR